MKCYLEGMGSWMALVIVLLVWECSILILLVCHHWLHFAVQILIARIFPFFEVLGTSV